MENFRAILREKREQLDWIYGKVMAKQNEIDNSRSQFEERLARMEARLSAISDHKGDQFTEIKMGLRKVMEARARLGALQDQLRMSEQTKTANDQLEKRQRQCEVEIATLKNLIAFLKESNNDARQRLSEMERSLQQQWFNLS